MSATTLLRHYLPRSYCWTSSSSENTVASLTINNCRSLYHSRYEDLHFCRHWPCRPRQRSGPIYAPSLRRMMIPANDFWIDADLVKTSCAASAIGATGCAVTDAKCVCSNTSFLSTVQTCIATACSPSDQQSTPLGLHFGTPMLTLS